MWSPSGFTHLTAWFFALSSLIAVPITALTSSGMVSAMNVLIMDKVS